MVNMQIKHKWVKRKSLSERRLNASQNMWRGVKNEKRKLSPTVFPVGAMAAGPSVQQRFALHPYVPWNTEDRKVHVGLHIFTAHTPPDTQVTNLNTQKHLHASCTLSLIHIPDKHQTQTQAHTRTDMHTKYKFIQTNRHNSTFASSRIWQLRNIWDGDGEKDNLMSYEGSRGQRESSVLAAVQPLKCHPDKASYQLEHSTSNTHKHTHICTGTPAENWEDAVCNHWCVA